MNGAQWHQRGFKISFCNDTVYLYRPFSGTVHHAPVNNGEWMNHDDLTQPPWTTVPNLPQGVLKGRIETTSQECYCEQIEATCDFCVGVRTN